MPLTSRPLFALLLAAVLGLGPLSAEAQLRHGGHGGHGGGRSGYGQGYWGPGPFWGGLGGLNIGIGIGLGAIAFGGPAYPVYPGAYVVAAPQPVVYDNPPIVPGQAVQAAVPEPIIYPRNGQSADQTEADRRDCNRWATTQPSAMAEASVFQRASLACMDGRGYTLR